MSDDKIKSFLKDSIQETPPAPFGEPSRIWRTIEGKSSHRTIWWAFLPVGVTAAALIFVLKMEKTYVPTEEEKYLYQEWSEMVSETDADVEQDFATVFEN